MSLTFQDALKALEGKADCQTAINHLRHMAMKEEQENAKNAYVGIPVHRRIDEIKKLRHMTGCMFKEAAEALKDRSFQDAYEWVILNNPIK